VSILTHVEASPEERAAYLKQKRLLTNSEEETSTDEEAVAEIDLSQERYEELAAKEQQILTVSERGFGKRTSSYEYRLAGRGGKGLWNMNMSARNGLIVSAFPVTEDQEVMLVTDGGKIIRMSIADVRTAGRRTQGVTLFRVDKDEKVVSVASLGEQDEEDTDDTQQTTEDK
jgi:DNA gyrase subunit A